nr:unnamed protein product [Spirometra erinaceieuropaei]
MDKTLMPQCSTDAPLSIVTDASNCSASAVLYQRTPMSIPTLAFHHQTRYDIVRRPLQRLYNGPSQVLSRTDVSKSSMTIVPKWSHLIGRKWFMPTLFRSPQQTNLLHLPRCPLRFSTLCLHQANLCISLPLNPPPTRSGLILYTAYMWSLK